MLFKDALMILQAIFTIFIDPSLLFRDIKSICRLVNAYSYLRIDLDQYTYRQLNMYSVKTVQL